MPVEAACQRCSFVVHAAAIFLGLMAALLRVQEILFIAKNAGILNSVADKIFQVWAVCLHGQQWCPGL